MCVSNAEVYLDDVAVDVVLQHPERLLDGDRSGEELDQVSRLDDHVRVARLSRSADGHRPLDEVKLARHAAFLTWA